MSCLYHKINDCLCYLLLCMPNLAMAFQIDQLSHASVPIVVAPVNFIGNAQPTSYNVRYKF